MSLCFETGGMLTSVQDEGRFGYQQLGVSPAGPMDARAFRIANILVGNQMGVGALETTYLGPTILFESDCVVAITGADMSPMIDHSPAPLYRVIPIRSGQRLKFDALKHGARGYIAVSGGLDIPIMMGSRSTLIRNRLGGVEGRAIKAGDRVALLSPKSDLPNMDERWLPVERYPKQGFFLRAIRGPQDGRFTRQGIKTFYQRAFTISKEFDRMGCRLEGPVIEQTDGANIMTDGLVAGSVQVPGNGQPIIMLADRQSTGGYTKIATVISVDLPLLAQAKPGDSLSFVEVDIELAHSLYIRQKKGMQYLESQWCMQA